MTTLGHTDNWLTLTSQLRPYSHPEFLVWRTAMTPFFIPPFLLHRTSEIRDNTAGLGFVDALFDSISW